MNPYLEQTDSEIALLLPWPPSVNTYWRNITVQGRARTVVSKKGREYQQAVMARMKTLTRRFNGRVKIVIEAQPPDRRKRDLDNILKSLLDSVTRAGLMQDDSQIDHLTIIRLPVVKGGQVKLKAVEITE